MGYSRNSGEVQETRTPTAKLLPFTVHKHTAAVKRTTLYTRGLYQTVLNLCTELSTCFRQCAATIGVVIHTKRMLLLAYTLVS
jgi:hypothetical protein